MPQQRKEMAGTPRATASLGSVRGLAADDLPRFGGDRLVVQVGQVDQPDDGRQVAAQPFEPVRGGDHARGPATNAASIAMAEERRRQRADARPGQRLGHEALGHVADAAACGGNTRA